MIRVLVILTSFQQFFSTFHRKKVQQKKATLAFCLQFNLTSDGVSLPLYLMGGDKIQPNFGIYMSVFGCENDSKKKLDTFNLEGGGELHCKMLRENAAKLPW